MNSDFTGVVKMPDLLTGDNRDIDYNHRMIAFIIDEDYSLVFGIRCDTCWSTTRQKLRNGDVYNQQALQDKFEELKQAHVRARLNEE